MKDIKQLEILNMNGMKKNMTVPFHGEELSQKQLKKL